MRKTVVHLKHQSGFSLAELMIVMAVVSVIIGGIWSLAKDTQNDVIQEQFSEQLSIIAKNTRAAYLEKSMIDSTNVSVVMPILMGMNAFPGDMVRTVAGNVQVLDTPWGQITNPILNASPYNSVYVCGWRPSGSTHCDFTVASSAANVPLIAIEALLPSGDICTKAVIRNSGPSSLAGLVDVVINGRKTVFLGNPLPVPLTFAQQNCGPFNATSSAAVVDFIIRPNPAGP